MRALIIVIALSLLGYPALALAGGDGLNLIPNITLLVANLNVLGLLIYPIQRWLLAPLVRVLVEREQRESGELAARRRRQGRAWFWHLVEEGIEARFRADPAVAALIPELEQQVDERASSAPAAARALLDKFRS